MIVLPAVVEFACLLDLTLLTLRRGIGLLVVAVVEQDDLVAVKRAEDPQQDRTVAPGSFEHIEARRGEDRA